MKKLMSEGEATFRALMVLSQSGDRQAYRTLLESVRSPLTAYFTRRLAQDRASAEDLVQDTLMALHEKRATYDPSRPFSGWLFGIARYKLIDHYRRSQRRMTIPLQDDDAVIAIEPAIAARLDIEALLSRLPPKQAAAIRLTRLTGLTAREAADRMETTESSVKVSVHRGLKSAGLGTGTPGDGTS